MTIDDFVGLANLIKSSDTTDSDLAIAILDELKPNQTVLYLLYRSLPITRKQRIEQYIDEKPITLTMGFIYRHMLKHNNDRETRDIMKIVVEAVIVNFIDNSDLNGIIKSFEIEI